MLWCFCGEGNGTPFQYSCLENPMDGGAWWAAVHGVAKSWARLSDFTFTFHFHSLEKATHSSILAWRIPGTEEPSGLTSMGSHRVRHDWSDLAEAAAIWISRLSNYAQHILQLEHHVGSLSDGSISPAPWQSHPCIIPFPCMWVVFSAGF